MKNDAFITIWNQLVLCTQFQVYGDPDKDIFDSLLKQTAGAWEKKKLTVRQFLVLQNAINEWREILAKQSRETDNGTEDQSPGQTNDVSGQDGGKTNLV